MILSEQQKVADRLMLARGKRAEAWKAFNDAHTVWMNTSLFYAADAKRARDEKDRTMKEYDAATKELDLALEEWHKFAAVDGPGK